MHFFVIDASLSDQVFLYVAEKFRSWQQYELPPSEDISVVLMEFLRSQNIALHSLSGIAVVQSMGTFSATRRLTIMVNTLAYSLQIPVVNLKSFSSEPVEHIFSEAKLGQYILPRYSAEPNITHPRI